MNGFPGIHARDLKTAQIGKKVTVGEIGVALAGVMSVIGTHGMQYKGPPDGTPYVQGFAELIVEFGAIVVLQKQVSCAKR